MHMYLDLSSGLGCFKVALWDRSRVLTPESRPELPHFVNDKDAVVISNEDLVHFLQSASTSLRVEEKTTTVKMKLSTKKIMYVFQLIFEMATGVIWTIM